MFANIEQAIGTLQESLQEALLLPTVHSYARSAAALGIDTDALAELERAAQEQLAKRLLGAGWRDDPVTLGALLMRIDEVAVHIQKSRERSVRGGAQRGEGRRLA